MTRHNPNSRAWLLAADVERTSNGGKPARHAIEKPTDKNRPFERPSIKPSRIDVPGERKLEKSSRTLQHLAREAEIELALRLFLLPDSARARKMVAFTSPESRSGCSSVCRRTAEVLASHGSASVCLVDCNLRAPSLHRHYQLPIAPGLVEGLYSADSLQGYTHKLPGTNLSVLTAGSIPDSPVAVLGGRELVRGLRELRNRFDYVLIDTAPVSVLADSLSVGSLSDGVVLVLQANSTRKHIAMRAKQRLSSASCHVLGAVLTKRSLPIPDFLYRRL